MSHIKEFQHLKIPLESIISATNNFSAENCIGKGGFGKVYKGEILHSKGKSIVAFKRLDRAFGQGDPEFWKEIMMLSVYSHENIVSLLGFCDESGEKILVYDYASKGSLDLYLEKDDLSWIQRLKICIGAARGLAYLHNPVGTHLRVLHRDIKSSNILVDENWNAKISDFGLSKLGVVNHQFSFFVSNTVGTIGYCDPLYIENGFLTKESDVYSFGVVLFEVLCGRLCFSNKNDKCRPLVKLARESYEENKISEIIHGTLKDEINHRSLKFFTRIAYQCLKRDREERPLMTDIVRILETALEYQINYRQPVENDATVSSGSTEALELRAETAQIKAAKQNSLGCSPSESLSLRYWSNNVINYDEKVMDGFYDVYGITSNSVTQAKMPSLVDLQATTVYDYVGHEVVLVDRTIDKELQLLEERVSDISLECRASGTSQVISMMIANIVVAQMGGPVSDADEMLRRWTTRSYELRNTLKTIILPLGCIDCGLSRHRALLFKVLADKINLACCLIKGSNYTGTDDGAVNLIKIYNGSEYIIDLMGAPGTLIPVEACNLQSIELEARSDAAGSDSSRYTLPDISTDPIFVTPVLDGFAKAGTSELTVTSIIGSQLNSRGENAVERNQTKRFESDFSKLLPDFGKLLPAFGRSDEGLSGGGGRTSPAQKLQLNDVSKYVINAVKNLKFAQKLHAVSLKGGGTSSDSLLDVNNNEVGETEVCKTVHLLDADMLNVEAQHVPALVMSSNYEQDLIFFTAPEVSNLNDNSQLVDNWLPAKQQQLVSDENNLGYTVPSQSTSAGFVEGLMNDHAVANSLERQSGDGVTGGEPRLINKARAGNTRKGKNLDTKLVETSRIGLDEVQWEIPWEDLQIGGRVGIGSYGEVYRSEWNGTEVALKKLINQDISGDVLTQFRGEVEMMLRLRHPNVVLFMGAVTRPPNLSILTEFLPRGSLFKLLHQSNVHLDEKRRLHMALDVAKGMNYLHTSNPIIVHRNLKTPNLLVDKNWVVKVCDFGMSRMKHNTFLSSKSTAGTPEWMAPEVLRNEPSNEKCDVYSFGVILWELATLRTPWTGMNSMQVVGAVGFQLRRLDIPEHLDPLVARIIFDCWHPEPHLRPSFKEIIARLKGLSHLSMDRTKT